MPSFFDWFRGRKWGRAGSNGHSNGIAAPPTGRSPGPSRSRPVSFSGAREPLPDYPDCAQSYAYQTQGICGDWSDGYGTYGGYGLGYGGLNGGLGGYGGGFGPGGLMGGGAVNVAGYPKAPTKESLERQKILSSGSWSYDPESGIVLSKTIDDVMLRQGPVAYALMMNDPVVFATVEICVLGILGDKHEVVPRIVAEPGERIGDEGDRRTDVEQAKKWADECRSMVDSFDRPFRETLRMTIREKLVNGASLSELEWAKLVEGPFAGRVAVSAVQPKPFPTWAFVTDPYLKVKAIWAWTYEGPQVIGLEDKFLISNWCPLSSDPRGTSVLRPAYDPWSFKAGRKPFRAKFISQFSDPSVVLEYDAMNVGTPEYPIGEDGRPDYTQQPYSPWEMGRNIAANFNSGSYAAIPVGWKLTILEVKANGEAFDKADIADNREIAQAILLAARSTQESTSSSKADNEGATDWSKTRTNYGRNSTCEDVQKFLFHAYVRRNSDKPTADKYAPLFAMSESHKGDHAPMITAYTGAGWTMIPRQKPAIDAEFGLPVRTADEVDEEELQAKAAKDAAVAAQAGKAEQESAKAGALDSKDGGAGKPTGELKPDAKVKGPKGMIEQESGDA